MTLPLAAVLLVACGGVEPNQGTRAEGSGTVSANVATAAGEVSGPVAPAPAYAGDFQSFWGRFRAAALAGDEATLTLLSAPVVTGHGELDDDASKKLTSAQLPAAIAKLLANATPLDGAGHTQRTLFEGKSTITPRDLDSPKQERIGNFVFKSGRMGWRLTDLYVGDD